MKRWGTLSSPPDLIDLHGAADALAVITRQLGVAAQQALARALDRLR